MILENENLVHSIVNRFSGYTDKEDLYQVGMIGLIKASKKYDESFETKFSTYAYTYIFGEINQYIRENNNVRVSKDIIKLKKEVEKAKDIMRQRLLREPTITEVSLFLEIDEEKLLQLEQITQETKSLDYLTDDNSSNLYNVVKCVDKNINPDIMDLKDEIDKLNDEEKEILYKRFYLDMTQTEASKELGISQVQVYRKENKIFQKLKSNL